MRPLGASRMESFEQLLETWCKSATVMHIAPHKAAASYAKRQRWLGGFVASLGALVASSLFVAASKGPGQLLVLLTGLGSLAAAVLTAVSASLDLGGKSQRHYAAAGAFQGLRREIEEELVRCRIGAPKDSYEHLRKRWTSALEGSIPLPQKVHDSVQQDPPTER
jgi:hypothetical protein